MTLLLGFLLFQLLILVEFKFFGIYFLIFIWYTVVLISASGLPELSVFVLEESDCLHTLQRKARTLHNKRGAQDEYIS